MRLPVHIMLSVIKLSVIMLSVITLSVIKLSVIKLSVIMLSVVALKCANNLLKHEISKAVWLDDYSLLKLENTNKKSYFYSLHFLLFYFQTKKG